MAMRTFWGLVDSGTISGVGKSLTPCFVLEYNHLTCVRVDGCADHMNKKPDLVIKNNKIFVSENTIPKI